MKKLLSIFTILCFLATQALGQSHGNIPRTTFESVDQTVQGRPRTLQVTNGAISDLGNSTFKLDITPLTADATSVTEAGTTPLVISPNTGDILVTMNSADTTTDGYIRSVDFAQFSADVVRIDILSADAVIQNISLDVLSADAIIQNIRLDILSADAIIQDQKLDILSADAVIQNISLDILSADVNTNIVNIGILSNDAAWSKNGTNIFPINLGSEVGIGTQTPSVSLDVVGNIRAIGKITGDALELTGGNVIFLNTTDDIESHIAGATAGDTIVLAAGTYTITDDIDITQKVHLKGQGKGITTITCSTDAQMLTITGAGTRITDMTISATGARTGTTNNIIDTTPFITLQNIEFINTTTGSGSVQVYSILNENGTAATPTLVEDCTFSSTGDIGYHRVLNNGGTYYATINRCSSVSSNGDGAFGGDVAVYTSGGEVNIYSSNLSNSYNAAFGVIECANGVVNVYNSTINGSGATAFDVKRTAGTLTLYDTTLVNNTTSGTITYAGSTSTNDLTGAGEITINDAGADVNTRIEGDGNIYTFFLDAGNDRIGIGTNAPAVSLDVTGSIIAGGLSTSETVFNQDSVDRNYRIETNNNQNTLFVDGGTDRVGIGTNAPAVSLDVFGTISGEALTVSGAYAFPTAVPSVDGSVISYDSATNTLGWGTIQASPSPGNVAQIVSVISSEVVTGNTNIPWDDSIPQITEGFEVFALPITPTNASSTLKIEVTVNAGIVTNIQKLSAALFQDADADALAAVSETTISPNNIHQLTFAHTMTAGTTSATTFRVRIGPVQGDVVTFNGENTARFFDGVMSSSLIITEYTP